MRRYIMKKVSFYFLFIMALFVLLLICKDVKAYSVTGHEDFKKITFVNGEKYLLNEYSKTSIDKTMSSLKGYAFGWRTVYYNINEEAYYEGITIFSRSNKSNDIVKFDYILYIDGCKGTLFSGTIQMIGILLSYELKYTYQAIENFLLASSNNNNLKETFNF